MSAHLIREARLIDPEAGVDRTMDLLATEGRVALVRNDIPVGEARERTGGGDLTVVRADGLWLWPGLVDPHVHFREPGFTEKETVRTGSRAAAAGGYTAVICEPNTAPPPDRPERVRRMIETADAESVVRLYLKATMTRNRAGRVPVDATALAVEPRVVALSDDGDPLVDVQMLEKVYQAAGGAGLPVSPHCEDSEAALQSVKAGVDPGFELAEPYTNEPNYVRRDIAAARRAGCRIHLSHVSTARSIEIIQEAGRDSDAVSWEVAPHHLLLVAEDYPDGSVPCVNPPLRTSDDRRALQEALLAGEVDCIASDHAPHTVEDKAHGARGLIGIETTLGLVLSHFVGEDGLSPSRAVRLMSLNPARVFGLRGGTLEAGAPADMVLIDPSRQWTVDPDRFKSKARNTPFGGWRLTGKAVATFVAGKRVFTEPDLRRRIERL